MESRIFRLTQKYQNNYLILAITFFIGSSFGFISSLLGVYSIFFTILILGVSIFWMCSSLFYFFSIRKTFLILSDSGIKFVFPFGYRITTWEETKQLEITFTKFQLVLEKNSLKRENDPFSILFYKKNEIPLHLFIERWQDEKYWEEDSLLILLRQKFDFKMQN